SRQDLSLFVMGVAGGIAGMIRYQNFTLLIIPFAFMLRDALKRPAGLRRIVALAFGVFVGFVPQLIALMMIHGSSLQNPVEQFLPWWKSPFVLHTLFSARNGLFTCTPFLVLCLAGLLPFVRSERRWGSIFLVLLLLQIYMNASMTDWWGSAAFGAR